MIRREFAALRRLASWTRSGAHGNCGTRSCPPQGPPVACALRTSATCWVNSGTLIIESIYCHKIRPVLLTGATPVTPLDPQDCGLGVSADQSGHSGGVVSVPTCWLSGRMHAVWSPDGPQVGGTACMPVSADPGQIQLQKALFPAPPGSCSILISQVGGTFLRICSLPSACFVNRRRCRSLPAPPGRARPVRPIPPATTLP
jgi:hypothetical protein